MKKTAKKKPAKATPPKAAKKKPAAKAPKRTTVPKQAATYTPPPLTASGWAPFRYPPQ